MHSSYVAKILIEFEQLASDQRLYAFEKFAHNLTIAARGAWSESNLSAEDKVEALKSINECLHRAIARVSTERLRTHDWKDEAFVGMVADVDTSLHPSLRGSLKWALETAIHAAQTKP